MIKRFLSSANRPVLGLALALLVASFTIPVFAQSLLPMPADGAYGGIVENNRVSRVVENNAGDYNFLQATIYGLFSNENMRAANVVFGVVAIVYLIIIGSRFIMAEGKEEALDAAKKHFAYVILGLLVISMSQIVGFTIFNPDQATNPDIFVNPNVHEAFYAKAMQIKLYIQIAIGGIALLSIITSAFMIMGSTGNEETINKERQLLQNFLFATILILTAEAVVKGIFYLPGRNREGVSNQAVTIGIQEIMGLVQALLSIVAGAALLMLVLAGLYYVVSFGDEERAGRAKRLFMNTLIAVVIIFSAYTILRIFF